MRILCVVHTSKDNTAERGRIMNDYDKRAIEWSDKYLQRPDKEDSPELYAAAMSIQANVTRPTMADIQWLEEVHYLAGATVDAGIYEKDVVMLNLAYDDRLSCHHLDGGYPATWPMSRITPNGKRYEIREVSGVDTANHPETLFTVEDYLEAPEGTIVVYGDNVPWTKIDADADIWLCGENKQDSQFMHATGPRRVLRYVKKV